jgi:hypothetical protein
MHHQLIRTFVRNQHTTRGEHDVARLTLVKTGTKANTSVAAHRASATEGEAARKLLEANGYVVRGPKNRQYELLCPFHEGPGAIPPRKSPNFYMNVETSKYFCQSVACGEKGNLRTLEKFFGVDENDEYVSAFKDRDTRLKEYQANLVPALRTPFYEHGLTDATIERFRLGYEPEHTETRATDSGEREITIPGRYVIPYLEGRRPRFFRYYDPNPETNGEGKWKYTWDSGAEATLFNPSDAMGDEQHGAVVLCEGELKAMLLCQMGYAAVAVPGAGMWKDEWQAMFTHARRILVCYDNDNPAFHVYDKPEKNQKCTKCANRGLDACEGHNPGQEAAVKRVDQLGWRAKNVVLPLPDESLKKTDINDFFMRDCHSNADFAELATGKRATPFKVQSLAEIIQSPPEEAEFLIEDGIISKGGRLLVAGKPKVGKSLFINNLALSLASGLPFLGNGKNPGFAVDHPTRTLLLDRELSKHSLFKRLTAFTDARPAFKAAHENLLIDHDHLVRLDQPNAYDTLLQLIEQNGAEVCILDTAYKFFGGDVESSSSLMKGFGVLDKLIHETGCAFVLTHHLKKSQGGNAKQNNDVADSDAVAGSFLWTGWPNATILLNFMNRSVENPFNSVATFTAFRDAAPPEPLALYRDRTSISYTAIEQYNPEQSSGSSYHVSGSGQVIKPTTELVANFLLEMCPTTEEDFLHVCAAHFGVSIPTIRPYFIDAMSGGDFERVGKKPPIIKFKGDMGEDEQTWEQEHGLPERTLPENAGISLDMDIMDMFDAATGEVL